MRKYLVTTLANIYGLKKVSTKKKSVAKKTRKVSTAKKKVQKVRSVKKRIVLKEESYSKEKDCLRGAAGVGVSY